MKKRLLIQFYYDSSTTAPPKYRPYPLLLLKIKKKNDVLNNMLFDFAEQKLTKPKRIEAIEKFIQTLERNRKKYCWSINLYRKISKRAISKFSRCGNFRRNIGKGTDELPVTFGGNYLYRHSQQIT